ncbi:hypothetical protein AAMO2058_001079200 [Amorphochlora amoebiformis]|mmetsp:Transcript_6701/g.10359  ORF Transcript_6701/g.10359 Transcript_6701/m.10359 type:complete len:688 (-) Transcript_6701:202-2265(-)
MAKTSSHSHETSLKAAILVQRLFRGFKDRHKYRRRVLLEAWDELEKKEEAELHYSAKEVGKMTEMYRKLALTSKHVDLEIEEQETKRRPSFVENRDKKDEDKEGKKEFKPTLSWLAAFMDRVGKKDYDSKPMPEAEIMSLLSQAYTVLSKLPNVVEVSIKQDKDEKDSQTLIVVGDLHGQAADILHILKTHGLPTKRKLFLFNGDFVDRGKFAIEVCIIIFTLKLLFPDVVYMNRGNHEADDINARDGFQDECCAKYNMTVYHQFNETFTALPLVHIANKKAMIVHGGLCWDAGVTIKKIQEIDRFVLHPSWESIMEDLMWSDPGGPSHNGASQNDRGCGCIFGEDIVDEFFEDNPPLNLLVRSHEKKESGFQRHFGGKVLTVFSASNYCGDNGNDGAVIEVLPSLDYRVHTFYATGVQDNDVKFADRYCTLSSSVAAKLIHRIAENRLQLLDCYGKVVKEMNEKKGAESKGEVITRVQWAQGLKRVLDLRVKFLFLQELLGVPLLGENGKRRGKFSYVKWLEKFAPVNQRLFHLDSKAAPAVKETLQKITDVLQRHRVAVKSMFRYFDSNGDGQITPKELHNGLVCLGQVYKTNFTKAEVDTLIEHLDKDGNKAIDYDEFLAHFSVSDSEIAKKLDAVPRSSVMRGGTLLSPPTKLMGEQESDKAESPMLAHSSRKWRSSRIKLKV